MIHVKTQILTFVPYFMGIIMMLIFFIIRVDLYNLFIYEARKGFVYRALPEIQIKQGFSGAQDRRIKTLAVVLLNFRFSLNRKKGE